MDEQQPDLYAILGITPDADQELVKAAFRILAKKYHPDSGVEGGTASEERFRSIQSAYDTLGDPDRRYAYDQSREAAARRAASEAKERAVREDNAKAQKAQAHREAQRAHLTKLGAAAIGTLAICGTLIASAWILRQPETPIMPNVTLAGSADTSGSYPQVSNQDLLYIDGRLDLPIPKDSPKPSSVASVDPDATTRTRFKMTMTVDLGGKESVETQSDWVFPSAKECEEFGHIAVRQRYNIARQGNASVVGVWYACAEQRGMYWSALGVLETPVVPEEVSPVVIAPPE